MNDLSGTNQTYLEPMFLRHHLYHRRVRGAQTNHQGSDLAVERHNITFMPLLFF